MEREVYFSKVSMDSEEVYNLVENYELRFEITRNILSMVQHNFEFIHEFPYITEEGEKGINKVSYVLSIKDKDDESIHGVLDRTASIFVKERDDETGEMKSKPVENTEDIEFYYDVLHEYVAFISRRRFGKSMFNDAFGEMLNECARKKHLKYSFYVESFNLGMSIEEMQEAVKLDKNIRELRITYRPANPDDALIDKAIEAKEKERLKESNATERSIIYKAKGKTNINGGAEIIQDDLKQLVTMNEDIPILDLTQRGYVVVTSVNKNGDVKTTTDTKPFVKITNGLGEFVNTAKKGIQEILRKGNLCD